MAKYPPLPLGSPGTPSTSRSGLATTTSPAFGAPALGAAAIKVAPHPSRRRVERKLKRSVGHPELLARAHPAIFPVTRPPSLPAAGAGSTLAEFLDECFKNGYPIETAWRIALRAIKCPSATPAGLCALLKQGFSLCEALRLLGC
jgi:hypothetical protein